MPEGPEVKLMTDQLSKLILNKTLHRIAINSGRYHPESAKNEKQHKKRTIDLERSQLVQLNQNLPSKVVEIKTHGKLAWMVLNNGWIVHWGYGMSGSIRTSFELHCHLTLNYSDALEQTTDTNQTVHYYDPRGFGNWRCSPNKDALNTKLRTLGIDITAPPTNGKQTALKLFQRYRKKNICKALMDQRILAGVGNYIKCEILYRTKTSPYASVSDCDCEALYQQAVDIATQSHRMKGATLYTYKNANDESGRFQSLLMVYDRDHDPLGNPVEQLKTSDDRTTHWVPAVQSGDRCPPRPPAKIKPTKPVRAGSRKKPAKPSKRIKITLQLKPKMSISTPLTTS